MINNINYPLRGSDIYNFFNKNHFKKPNILPYSTITEKPILTFDNGFCAFVLYESEVGRGHWTLLFYDEQNDEYVFFDPYGYFIDDQLNWSKYSYSTTDKKKLIDFLMNTDDDEFEINDVQFQKKESNIQTCGKWCCVRYWAYKNGITTKEYENYFKNIPMNQRDKECNDIFNALN